MKLEPQLVNPQTDTGSITLAERAELSCQLAKQFEKAGDYEAACEAVDEFWPNRKGPPKLEGLEDSIAAEVLLRVGALAGWQGASDQTEDSQETAKNLLTRSIEIFERVRDSRGAAEARAEIIVKCGKCERAIELVEKIINVEGARRAGKNAQAERAQLHATALTPFAAGKCTSNSVQSFSDRTRRKSPPCSRVSSRAKFKPIPWPEAAEGVEL